MHALSLLKFLEVESNLLLELCIAHQELIQLLAVIVAQLSQHENDSLLVAPCNGCTIMIFLIEQVLPQGYFDQSLRALSVDMAVLRRLLHQRLPKTARHLDELQRSSADESEPPLTNVFSMHWFLTLFATCLPKSCVFRLWDALMLDGSEVLLRAALAIWAKLSKKVLSTTSTDHFYTNMATLCQKLALMRPSEIDNFITIVYTMSEFPYPGISELRTRFTWNVESHPSTFTQMHNQISNILHIADDDLSDSEYASCVACGSDAKEPFATKASDMAALQKQYKHVRQRQQQAAVIIQAAFEQGCSRMLHFAQEPRSSSHIDQTGIWDSDASETMFNHLCVNAMLVGLHTNKSLVHTTLYGAVPVTSTMVQPVNVDTFKGAIDFVEKGYRYRSTSEHDSTDKIDYIKIASSLNAKCIVNNGERSKQRSNVMVKRSVNEDGACIDKFQDDEIFLSLFIKSNDTSTTRDGIRKTSAPAAVGESSGDSLTRTSATPERSLSCAGNFAEGHRVRCNDLERKPQTARFLSPPPSLTERKSAGNQLVGCERCSPSRDTPKMCDAVPRKFMLMTTNADVKPQVDAKRTSDVTESATLAFQHATHYTLKKQTLRRSLAVLERLTKQSLNPHNALPSNPFPVIHKNLNSTSIE